MIPNDCLAVIVNPDRIAAGYAAKLICNGVGIREIFNRKNLLVAPHYSRHIRLDFKLEVFRALFAFRFEALPALHPQRKSEVFKNALLMDTPSSFILLFLLLSLEFSDDAIQHSTIPCWIIAHPAIQVNLFILCALGVFCLRFVGLFLFYFPPEYVRF